MSGYVRVDIWHPKLTHFLLKLLERCAYAPKQGRLIYERIDFSCQKNFNFSSNGFFLSVKNMYCGKFHALRCLWDKLTMGRVFRGTKCPWGELSIGQGVYEASCPWGELSMG
jgi:hypothetical protein